MTIGKWLKYIDAVGLDIIIWVSGDEEEGPFWKGSVYNFPLRYADLQLETDRVKLDYEEPIRFRNDLGEECNHKAGFVVIVKGD